MSSARLDGAFGRRALIDAFVLLYTSPRRVAGRHLALLLFHGAVRLLICPLKGKRNISGFFYRKKMGYGIHRRVITEQTLSQIRVNTEFAQA